MTFTLRGRNHLQVRAREQIRIPPLQHKSQVPDKEYLCKFPLTCCKEWLQWLRVTGQQSWQRALCPSGPGGDPWQGASPADGLSWPLALAAAQGLNTRLHFSHRNLSWELSKCQGCRSNHTAQSDTLRNSGICWCWFSPSSEGVTPAQTIKPPAQVTPVFPWNSNKKAQNQNRDHPNKIVWNRFCSVKTKEERRPRALDIGLTRRAACRKGHQHLYLHLCGLTFVTPCLWLSKSVQNLDLQSLQRPRSTGLSKLSSPGHSRTPSLQLHPFSITNTKAFPLWTLFLEFLLLNLWRQRFKPLFPEEEKKYSFCIYEGAISSCEIFHATHSCKRN